MSALNKVLNVKQTYELGVEVRRIHDDFPAEWDDKPKTGDIRQATVELREYLRLLERFRAAARPFAEAFAMHAGENIPPNERKRKMALDVSLDEWMELANAVMESAEDAV